jgi:hypothetical protein
MGTYSSVAVKTSFPGPRTCLTEKCYPFLLPATTSCADDSIKNAVAQPKLKVHCILDAEHKHHVSVTMAKQEPFTESRAFCNA